MSHFNCHTLDTSIHDVITHLSTIQKVDVLMHALEHLPTMGCRTILEETIQSLLGVPDLPPANIARALLLRAKRRLSVGYHTSAWQDLHSVLELEPENKDAKASILLLEQKYHPGGDALPEEPSCPLSLPEDVWRQVALFLPKRDLKSLLLVSNVPSRVASQLLFRELDLHLTTSVEPAGGNVDRSVDVWHDRRSADIFTQIFVNSHFAGRVRDLTIFAIPSSTTSLTFKTGMLMNALAELLNLRRVHCSGDQELISQVLQAVHLYSPNVQQLSLVVTGRNVNDVDVPVFKHLTRFAVRMDGRSVSFIITFLNENRATLRSISIKHSGWQFPTQAIAVRHLTQIEFDGRLTMDAFSEILDKGHQLKSLMLSGMLLCAPSSLFRQFRNALPLLHHFSFVITGVHHIADIELCSAISDFLQERTQLQSYHFVVTASVINAIGFNSSSWGVLPALSKLRSLSITYPKDLPPELASWLVPRSVRALTLDLSPVVTNDLTHFMNVRLFKFLSSWSIVVSSTWKQLRTAMPPRLRYISIMNKRINPVLSIVERGFSDVRVVRTDMTLWTVIRSGEGGVMKVEQWPDRRTKCYAAEWLESLGCVDAIWQGLDVLPV